MGASAKRDAGSPVLRTAPDRLLTFVEQLQASGRYSFDRAEALSALHTSEEALKKAARRLALKRRLASPRRGFFVIVPVEYRSSGAPPPAWFIDALMRYEGRPYYVALLSAAALHGAAHQQPQEFEVMTDRPLRPSRVGRSRIRFFTKRRVAATATTKLKTETGEMVVSTPATTALDLVRYAPVLGGLGAVLSVLSELAEKLDAAALVKAAEGERNLALAQRTGFLLERSGAASGVIEPLATWIATQAPRPVALRSDRDVEGVTTDARWQVLVNEAVEVDP
ncbi:MAG: type IV toxin-antitoxin system AbiEi family antitoxin [Deltaproteobacteria bacterium]|nr:type IV toxin-antitoxin system AbiEi family antitoxin [Deltaproteobacteria bacterium]